MGEPPFRGLSIKPETLSIAAGDRAMVPEPFMIGLPDGRTSIPATSFGVVELHAPSGAGYVVVHIIRLGLVLHEAFTPDGAREMAAALVRSADALDAAMLERSNAQLAAALAKGKRA